jgi:hypothetical protein
LGENEVGGRTWPEITKYCDRRRFLASTRYGVVVALLPADWVAARVADLRQRHQEQGDLRLRDRRDVLKDILEHAVPTTLQDVVIITVIEWPQREAICSGDLRQ